MSNNSENVLEYIDIDGILMDLTELHESAKKLHSSSDFNIDSSFEQLKDDSKEMEDRLKNELEILFEKSDVENTNLEKTIKKRKWENEELSENTEKIIEVFTELTNVLEEEPYTRSEKITNAHKIERAVIKTKRELHDMM